MRHLQGKEMSGVGGGGGLYGGFKKHAPQAKLMRGVRQSCLCSFFLAQGIVLGR